MARRKGGAFTLQIPEWIIRVSVNDGGVRMVASRPKGSSLTIDFTADQAVRLGKAVGTCGERAEAGSTFAVVMSPFDQVDIMDGWRRIAGQDRQRQPPTEHKAPEEEPEDP